MVRGGHNHRRLGVECCNTERGIRNTRRSVATNRLSKHLFGAEFGKFTQHLLGVDIIGHHQKVLVGNNSAESLKGVAQERTTRAEDIQKLFGTLTTAEWPESRANSARHNHTISFVIVHYSFSYVFCSIRPKSCFAGSTANGNKQIYNLFTNISYLCAIFLNKGIMLL